MSYSGTSGFLRKLVGERGGRCRTWLENLGREPRIAWYPSGGEDFRPLMYLSGEYSEAHPVPGGEPLPPDLFLYTDYFPWSTSRFLDTPVLYQGTRTAVTATHMERLPRVDLPLDPGILDFPRGGRHTGSVVFLETEVRSDVLGTLRWPVLYAFCENEAFCACRMLADQGPASHVIHVRYGGGMGGGGRASGAWLVNVLHRVGCEVFVEDGHLDFQEGDDEAIWRYPGLGATGPEPRLEPMRRMAAKSWSNHGDVTWNRVVEGESVAVASGAPQEAGGGVSLSGEPGRGAR